MNVEWLNDPKFIRKWLSAQELNDLRIFVRALAEEIEKQDLEIERLRLENMDLLAKLERTNNETIQINPCQ